MTNASGGGRKPRTRDQAKLIFGGILLAVVILFAVLNLHKAKINWIVASSETPVTIVIAISVLFGAAIGVLWSRRRSNR